jgi:hypothetical protein
MVLMCVCVYIYILILYIHIYIYIYMCVCIYIYISTHTQGCSYGLIVYGMGGTKEVMALLPQWLSEKVPDGESSLKLLVYQALSYWCMRP